jgi:hypothetical protein
MVTAFGFVTYIACLWPSTWACLYHILGETGNAYLHIMNVALYDLLLILIEMFVYQSTYVISLFMCLFYKQSHARSYHH